MSKSDHTSVGGLHLTTAIAETVFDWKEVRKAGGGLVGKKQDKLGRWRSERVPDYAGEVGQAYAIEERMRQLGKAAQYAKELAKIAKAKNLPPDWATPDLRARAALQVMRLKLVK